MAQDPTYNIYRYAFKALSQDYLFDDEPLNLYADSIVNDLLEINKYSEGIEASIIMNLWMEVVHNVHEVVRHCRLNDDDKALHALDIAAAYWIGDGQNMGSNSDGYLLYAIAEHTGSLFGQDFGETRVNARILNWMNKIKNDILLEGKCKGDNNLHTGVDVLVELRILVDKIVSQMSIPLLQNLYRYMRSGTDLPMVELYAVSFIPQVAGCNNSTYAYLLKEFVSNKFDTSHFMDITKTLQNSYSCLRIKCEDVGNFGTVLPECVDRPNNAVLAGYVPTSNITEVS